MIVENPTNLSRGILALAFGIGVCAFSLPAGAQGPAAAEPTAPEGAAAPADPAPAPATPAAPDEPAAAPYDASSAAAEPAATTPAPTGQEPALAVAAPEADVQSMPAEQPMEEARSAQVGGHAGIATPLVTVTGDGTDTIADQFTLLHPIGVTVKLTDRLAVDFEFVVANPIDPDGNTGLVVDPGVIYNLGPVAVGLRAAWQINALTNFGLIPLVNRGLVDLGGATWFVEAAFPTFYSDEDVAFNVVLHTGVGF